MNSQHRLFTAFEALKADRGRPFCDSAKNLAEAVAERFPTVGYGQRFFEAQHFVWADGRPIRRTGVGLRNPAILKAVDEYSRTATSKMEMYRLLYDNTDASSHACCNAALVFSTKTNRNE